MALQDLTPQLRTRLSRMERLVGLCVFLAVVLLLTGLSFYVYSTAQRQGWFLTKASYYTYLRSGAGLAIGDTIRMMGFPAGEITVIKPEKPFTYDAQGRMLDVYVEFLIKGDNIGFIWNDSKVKVKSAGLLGARYLEITKGGTSGATKNLFPTYKEKHGRLDEIYSGAAGTYTNYVAGAKYGLEADEPPELSTQMDAMVAAARDALPNFLSLTNQFRVVMDNLALTTGQLDQMLTNARPLVTNLSVITANLRDPRGSLGDWLLPTNLQQSLTQTLSAASTTLISANSVATNADTQLTVLAAETDRTLKNVSLITSNLNKQMQVNTNMLTEISSLITNTDNMITGLKRHWLLRSAFKEKKTNAPAGGRPILMPPKAPFPPNR
jgi:ABC-type transporter Mla subunit MlaD